MIGLILALRRIHCGFSSDEQYGKSTNMPAGGLAALDTA
jgi:hypothetical protein